VEGLRDHFFGKMRPLILLVLGAVGIVLLIACANVAGLLLVRAVRRDREVGIRLALGAGRFRIIRQLLTESLLLSLAGGALGLVLAVASNHLFTAFAARAGMGLVPIQTDGTVVAFTLLVSMVTCLLFGLVPAIQGSRINLNNSLKEGSRASSAGLFSQRLNHALVVGEVAFSLVLLVATGLLVRSLVSVTRQAPGYETEHILTLAVGEVQSDSDLSRRAERFWPELLARVEALPEVRAAALSHAFPMSAEHGTVDSRYPISTIDQTTRSPDVLGEYQSISPEYFRVLGIRLMGGRFFTNQDLPTSAPDPPVPVAIINESLARQLWGKEDAVGKQFVTPRQRYTVIGVVRDVRQYGPRLPSPPVQVYLPIWYPSFFKLGTHYLIVRTTADPRSAAAAVKGTIASVDSERSVTLVRPLKEVALQRTAWDWVGVVVAGVFGVIATLLTAVGLYALLAHSISRRIPEIGIRLALGGRPAQIFRMALMQGFGLALAGIGAGTGAALVLSGYLVSALFEISARDPLTYCLGALLLAGIALGACWFPARQAIRVDPVVALRSE
jgi:putative ABC transport system permease protein